VPLLSVIIPVFNERDSIARIVGAVREVGLSKEILLVDDASTDGTQEVIEREILPGSSGITYIRHDRNRGKGAAIRTALPRVQGDIVLVQDADLEYSPADYPRLVEPIVEGRAAVVYGSRFRYVNKWLFVWQWFLIRFLGRHYEIRYLHHFLGIQLLNLLANVLYGARITDEATCYKVVKASVLRDINLRCEGFEFCPELTAKLRKKGHAIVEVPITYHPRTRKEGKKLNWKHGFQAVWTLIKYRFVD
jgi:glycosyltransferase involved in cell wall biosynthesis